MNPKAQHIPNSTLEDSLVVVNLMDLLDVNMGAMDSNMEAHLGPNVDVLLGL
jgi:hypothetical protein